MFTQVKAIRLLNTSAGDGGGGTSVLDSTGRAAAGLDRLDDAHGGGVAGDDLAEDDVAAVEPAGDDGGDEELGAVAIEGDMLAHLRERLWVVPGCRSVKHTCWGRRWPWTA